MFAIRSRSACLPAHRIALSLVGFSLFALFSPERLGATEFIWVGGGWPPNADWDTAANWNQGPAKPNNDDDLQFTGAVPLVNTNNRPLSVVFNSITVSSPGYEIRGQVPLDNGLKVTHGSGVTRFKEGLRLTREQTIQVTHSAAALHVDCALELPCNGTPDVIIIGEPPPIQTITFQNAGTIRVARLSNNGARFEKYGDGSLLLEGTYGTYQVGHIHQGFLIVDGPAEGVGSRVLGPQLGLHCALHHGGTLTGSGEVRSISTVDGGTVVPGWPLTVSGDVSLGHPDATFRVSICGIPPQACHHQLVAEQTVDLTGPAGRCRLEVVFFCGRPGFIPVVGQSYRIIDNLGGHPVSGTFANLPQNAVTNVNGVHFQISYTGGTGNDVVLTIVDVDPTGVARVWDGGGMDNYWTNRFNWVGDFAPHAGDDLRFPSAPGLNNTNNYPGGVTFNSVSLTGGGYNLRGNALRLKGGLHTSQSGQAPQNTVDLALTLDADQSFTNNSSISVPALVLSGEIMLNGHALTFQNDLADTCVSAVISGEGELLKRGSGQLLLEGANTYQGMTRVLDGRLTLSANGLPGTGLSSANGTVVSNTGSLHLLCSATLFEPLTLSGTGDGNGALVLEGGAPTVWAGITLAANTRIKVASGELTLRGGISGPGGLEKSGHHKLTLSGNSDNTYAGTTLVNDGVLELKKDSDRLAVPGNLSIGDGDTEAAEVHVLNYQEISDTAAVVVNSDGRLWLFTSDIIASLAGSGLVAIDANHALTVGSNDSTEFSGSISGGGELRKFGLGVLTLSGNCSHSASIVYYGKLAINNSHAGNITTFDNGILGGSGQVGGHVALNGPSGIDPDGVLNVQGNLQAHSSSTLWFDFQGLTPGVGYDQLAVAGTVALNGAHLSVQIDPGFDPSVNTQFTIIHNAGLNPVLGQFMGLSNGDLLNVGSLILQIYYSGGTGNDVVLTRVAPQQMNAVMLPLNDGPGRICGQFLPNHPVLLEAATGFLPPIRWIVVDETRCDARGHFVLSDPEVSRHNSRFYRVRTP